nr:DUF2935 domain-containing protein [uncultured Clostridium sp.]
MNSTKQLIQLAFETHCFYIRILRDETIFIKNFLTPSNLKAVQEIDQFNQQYETLLDKLETITMKKDSTITNAVETISQISQKALLITSEMVMLYKTILRNVFNQDTSWWLQQFIEEAACYIRILTKLEQHESVDMGEIALWHRTMIYNSWFLYNIIEPSEVFLRQKVYKLGNKLERFTFDVKTPLEIEYIETIQNIIRELIEYAYIGIAAGLNL